MLTAMLVKGQLRRESAARPLLCGHWFKDVDSGCGIVFADYWAHLRRGEESENQEDDEREEPHIEIGCLEMIEEMVARKGDVDEETNIASILCNTYRSNDAHISL